MTRCPYCLAGIVEGQPLCYTCGRFVEGSQGMAARVAPRPSSRTGTPPPLRLRRIALTLGT